MRLLLGGKCACVCVCKVCVCVLCATCLIDAAHAINSTQHYLIEMSPDEDIRIVNKKCNHRRQDLSAHETPSDSRLCRMCVCVA